MPLEVILSACSSGNFRRMTFAYQMYGPELKTCFEIDRHDLVQKIAHVAAGSGQGDMLTEAIRMGAKIDNNILKAGLRTSSCNVFMILFQWISDPEARDVWVNRHFLRAIAKADMTMLKLAASKGAHPNSPYQRRGHRALALAVVCKNSAILSYLCQLKAHIHHCGAIAAAVIHENDSALNDLLNSIRFYSISEGNDRTHEEEEELTSALIMGVSGTNWNAVRLLLSHAVSPWRENSLGLTAMQVAISKGNAEMTHLLAHPSPLYD